MTAAVDVRDVSVVSSRRVRLQSVSLQAYAGEIHALIGPNGSGKSTLLSVIAGELAPTTGQVLVEETPWTAIGARDGARRRALLAQETPMAFPFTVQDVVSWGRLPWRGTPRQADDLRVIDQAIADQGLQHLRERPITTLSGGERARAHLARVLSQEASLLLLDEADATLDVGGQAQLDRAVRTRRDAGDCIVLVGHDLGRLSALADRVTLLACGSVVAQGTPEILTDAALSAAYGVPVRSERTGTRRVFWAE